MSQAHEAGAAWREREVVVPSLRVDVLGGKAFGLSRSYFAKGVAAGRVSMGGKAVGKSSEMVAGDEALAAGLGRFRLLEVLGQTKKGNLKVRLASLREEQAPTG